MRKCVISLLCLLQHIIVVFVFCGGVFLSESKAEQSLEDKKSETNHIDNKAHTVVYTSLDHARAAFITGGFKRSLSGAIEHSGFYVEAQLGLGAEPSRQIAKNRIESAQSIWKNIPKYETRFQTHASIGYQWMTGQGVVSGSIGLEHHTNLNGSKASKSTTKDDVGIRANAEIWHHPTAETLIQLNLVGSSVKNSVWARGSVGYALFEHLPYFSDIPMISMFKHAFMGPEISIYHEPQIGLNYTKIRYGAHIANIKINSLKNAVTQINLSGGFQKDPDKNHGIYCNLGFSQKW